VHSFDPYPWNTAATEAQAELNRLTNVTTHTVGLGKETRTIEVLSLSSKTFNAEKPVEGHSLVIRIDSPKAYLHLHPTFLKIDIEGAEYELIDTDLLDFPSVRRGYVEMHSSFIKAGGGDPSRFLRRLSSSGFSLFLTGNVTGTGETARYPLVRCDDFSTVPETAYYFNRPLSQAKARWAYLKSRRLVEAGTSEIAQSVRHGLGTLSRIPHSLIDRFAPEHDTIPGDSAFLAAAGSRLSAISEDAKSELLVHVDYLAGKTGVPRDDLLSGKPFKVKRQIMLDAVTNISAVLSR
jgi:FkbM family methyltransferase